MSLAMALKGHWRGAARAGWSTNVARFLDEYRSPQSRAPRVERILAFSRTLLAVTALVAIYFDPTEPRRFAGLVYGLLLGYAVYSVIVLAVVRGSGPIGPRLAVTLHGIDMVWASALTFFSDGPISPFFLFFLFVSLAAAYRWGFRETLATTGLTALILLLETGLAVAGPWRDMWFPDVRFELNPIIIQTTYLLLTGLLLGYLSDQEKQFRAEMAATTDAMQQPRVERGFGGSVEAIARLLQRMFRARAIDIVIHDHETARSTLWHAAGHERESVRRLQLDDAHREAWLFASPPAAWCSVGAISGAQTQIVTLASDSWSFATAPVTLPVLLTDDREFSTIAGVDFGLAEEWQGRILVFDPQDGVNPETRVHFLSSLSDHITPVLSNVFLLRRLRSRAGAVERARVARELHDGAIQALIGIEMKTETLRRRAEREVPDLVPEIAGIQNLLREEVVALRELMQELRPIELDAPRHLPDLLAVLVERFGRETGVSATFSSTVDTSRLPLRQASEVVRIVQEALVNVRKHSRARHVVVRLSDRDGGWLLTIEDDGVGFPFEGRLIQAELDARWLGPTTIKERARALGGHVTVESTPGRGASVEVTFHVTDR